MTKYLDKVLYVLPSRNRSLAILVFLFVLVSSLEFLGIGLVGPFISLAQQPSSVDNNWLLGWFYRQSGIDSKIAFISLCGAIVVVVFVAKSLLSWWVQSYVFRYSHEQKAKLSTRLMHAYLTAPYIFHLTKNSAELIQSIIEYTYKYCLSILVPILTIASNIIILISLIGLLCITNIVIVSVVLLLITPILIILNNINKNEIRYWGKIASQANESVIRSINHGIGGIKETITIGCESHFINQLYEKAIEHANASSSFTTFKLLPRYAIEICLVAILIGFTSISVILNKNTQNLTSILSVFALVSIRLIPATSNILGGIHTLRNSSYILDRLYNDLKSIENLKVMKNQKIEIILDGCSHNKKQAILNSSESHSLDKFDFNNTIVIKNISYTYPGTKIPAINNLSLTLHKGSSIGIIGRSGAGKTTLVDVILGLLIPHSGDILADEYSIYSNVKSWQSIVGYIPQNIYLADESIKRNIAFGSPDSEIDFERLEMAIQMSQLEDVVSNLPNGINTSVGDRGILLSGGQKQRIGIARQLYHGREILILDEATAALDNETESLITDAIKSLSGSKTTIIIAHRLTTLSHCDRIYEIEKGKIVKSGSYSDVILV
jgi:ABC-type multidrug transport system fused ATPase/permease subunit